VLRAIVLIEVDTTALPHPRMPPLMSDARCPFCGQRLVMWSRYAVVELVPVEVPGWRER
jgi:hypothetical protein